MSQSQSQDNGCFCYYYHHKEQYKHAQGGGRGQVPVGSGQGLQMPGGISEHVLDIEEDLWPKTAPEPVAILCSLPHVTSLGLLSALGGEF